MLHVPYMILVGNDPPRNLMKCLPPSLEYLALPFNRTTLAIVESDMNDLVVQSCEAIYSGYFGGSLPFLKGVEITGDLQRWPITDHDMQPDVSRFPDVRHIVSAFEAHQIKLGVSLVDNGKCQQSCTTLG